MSKRGGLVRRGERPQEDRQGADLAGAGGGHAKRGEALISCPATPEDRRVFDAVVFFTGARPVEVIALRWGDIIELEPISAVMFSRATASKQKVAERWTHESRERTARDGWTHESPERTARDGYLRSAWTKRCREMAKLRLRAGGTLSADKGVTDSAEPERRLHCD